MKPPLLHLARYRLSLTRIIQTEFYPERTVRKAWGRLYALEKAGYLAKHVLPTRGKYWTLGKNGIAHIGGIRGWDQPLRSQAFRKWLSTLLFCYGGKKNRVRLNAFEMGKLPPGGYYQKQLFESRNYYIERDDDIDRIGCIRPAADADPYLVARKCRGDFTLHQRHEAFESLVSEERFIIAAVVSNRFQVKPLEKAIEAQLAELYVKRRPVRVYLRPSLASLLPLAKVST